MSFFDNWRVQTAMTGNGMSQEQIDEYDRKYNAADEPGKNEIFDIYRKDVDRGMGNQLMMQQLLNSLVWRQVCSQSPHFAIIDKDEYKASIMNAKSQADRDAILKKFVTDNTEKQKNKALRLR